MHELKQRIEHLKRVALPSNFFSVEARKIEPESDGRINRHNRESAVEVNL
jgi:hypothetical protein